jgi:hypothetical protein
MVSDGFVKKIDFFLVTGLRVWCVNNPQGLESEHIRSTTAA